MNALLRLILVPVATAVSAALTGWLARHFPGVGLPAKDLTALMVAGGVAGATGALHWLSRQPKVVHLADEAKEELEKLRAEVAANTALTAPLSDIDAALKAHADQIIAEVGGMVHAPQSIVSLVESIVSAVDARKQPGPAAQTIPVTTSESAAASTVVPAPA